MGGLGSVISRAGARPLPVQEERGRRAAVLRRLSPCAAGGGGGGGGMGGYRGGYRGVCAVSVPCRPANCACVCLSVCLSPYRGTALLKSARYNAPA